MLISMMVSNILYASTWDITHMLRLRYFSVSIIKIKKYCYKYTCLKQTDMMSHLFQGQDDLKEGVSKLKYSSCLQFITNIVIYCCL